MMHADGLPELNKNEIDEIVELYKSIHPHTLTLSSAIVRKKSSSNVLVSVWNQRNLERGSNIKIQKTTVLDSAFQSCIELDAVDVSQRLLCSYSKSKDLRAIIYSVNSDDAKNKTKEFLDVWNEGKSLMSFDFTALDVHGPVYNDDVFGCLEWSPKEDKIVYVAEKKLPKVVPFYQQAAKTESSSDKSETRVGEQFVYKDDWGEQMSPKTHPVIAVCDVDKKEITVLTGVPEDIAAGHIRWDPNGDGVVGVGIYQEPRRLGIIYCTNRRSCVFHLNNEGKFNILSDSKMATFSPRFSPDGRNLVWLERHVGGPHHTASALVKCDWATKKVTKIVDFVDSVTRTKNGKNFYGIFSESLPSRCWTSDSRYVLLSTSQLYRKNSYVIDIEDGSIWDIGSTDENESTSILDVSENNFVVCSKSSFAEPSALAWLHIPSTVNSLSDGQVWNCITQHNITDTNIISRFEVLDLSTGKELCYALYYGPTSEQPLSVPLILFPHGGPHASNVSAYSPTSHFFTRLGFGVLFVNFRGSTCCGKDFVEALLGNVGSMDVQDCYCALQNAFSKFPWLDPKRVFLLGGSHGGFLVTHLSSQYPNEFKAVVAVNPVVHIPAMVYTTDIPDWTVVECGKEYKGIASVLEDEELWKGMAKSSPFYNIKNVKVPTLLLIGKKDLRVPPSQGLSYFKALKELKIPTKAMCYDDNHSLSSVPVEMDWVINTALWFKRCLKR